MSKEINTELLEALKFLVDRVEEQGDNRFSVRVVAINQAKKAIKNAEK